MNALRLCAVACCALIACVVGCTGNAFPDDGFSLDGGPSAAENDGCVPIGVDAGPDAGIECAPNVDAAQACEALVAQTCGATCTESPGCAAATLLQQYEPERCAEALADSQTYPTCELGNCDTLVAKVCGDDETCLDAPGCPPAVELQSRANDAKAEQAEREGAAAECLQALEDDVIFAACAE